MDETSGKPRTDDGCPSWKTGTSRPPASRFIRIAVTGRSRLRNATASSRNDKPSTIAMTSGVLFATSVSRSAVCALSPPTSAVRFVPCSAAGSTRPDRSRTTDPRGGESGWCTGQGGHPAAGRPRRCVPVRRRPGRPRTPCSAGSGRAASPGCRGLRSASRRRCESRSHRPTSPPDDNVARVTVADSSAAGGSRRTRHRTRPVVLRNRRVRSSRRTHPGPSPAHRRLLGRRRTPRPARCAGGRASGR